MERAKPWWRRFERRRLPVLLLAPWKLWRHPDTPWAPKLVAVVVVAYALSPIDLIPDFIPLLGQLDDALLLPLGIALAVWLTPAELWQARLREAEAHAERLPRLMAGAVAVVVVWLALLALLGVGLWHLFAKGSP
ncbi:DUF1232 domain-containing protein [Calidifontimicrobium sp. SYSU G02091]|uniref:YkvA family protein n=1 Tax=Calidifontimicrobium sp. SYSU G02091 TaxID=2926421 RepID=UPI001F53CACD|nr:YkvA family protein [Calidifontimicrobium sp. SYSU G02091]MCI1193284.1 DUF1232 domain-containing protein [Calidifontimicrobium sp. SYSU G02091]